MIEYWETQWEKQRQLTSERTNRQTYNPIYRQAIQSTNHCPNQVHSKVSHNSRSKSMLLTTCAYESYRHEISDWWIYTACAYVYSLHLGQVQAKDHKSGSLAQYEVF